MIKELELSNFRGFNKRVKVKFAPITVLVGRNNSGKSSIIKFLLMLQQSLESESGGFLVPRGNKTNLGPFPDLKNRLSHNSYLSFSLSLEDSNSSRDSLALYLKKTDKSMWSKGITFNTTAEVSYNKCTPFQGKQHSFSLKIEDNEVIVRSTAINQNSKFLDFSDVQNNEVNANLGVELLSRKIDAEKAIIESIASKIFAICHISSHKEIIRRTFDTGKSAPEAYVGKNGQFALHHLWNIYQDEDQSKIDFVNSYMESVLNISNLKFANLKNGEFSQCLAMNRNTKAENNLADFGHGLSQCFPIFVQGAIMSKYSTLICEQPEAQVHPSAQLELGQFFADLWKSKGVASIIETHSDNILLRLRRLVSTGKLKSSDVNVVYFIADDEQVATVKNLSINRDGTMQEGLAAEFFHQNIWEALKMRKRSESDRD